MFNSLLHTIGSWMKGKRRSLIGLGLLAIGLVAFMALGPSPARSGGNYLAKLRINDGFLVGQALFSDDKGWYIDHRLTDGDFCVTALAQGGWVFIYLDYNPEVGFCCSKNTGNPLRTYTLVLPEGCGPTDRESFRIRSENLFGKKRTTTVAFMFFDGVIGYEVMPDVEVAITGGGNTRTLTYSGTATLWRFTKISKGERVPVRICSSFSFPFEITVERVAQ